MKNNNIDILAIGIHPDDIEIGCGGTIASMIQKGKSVVLLDLTQGEMGTRGDAITRLKEAEDSAKILGVKQRICIDLEDVWAEESKENCLKIVEIIRHYRPMIILSNAKKDRHPDHSKGYRLVKNAIFISGLSKVKTFYNGIEQEAFRPKNSYNYIQSMFIEPNFVVDISEFMDVKFKAIESFKSQFYNPNSTEPRTFISDKSFYDLVYSQNTIFGKPIGVKYAEGFTSDNYLGIEDITSFI